MVVGFWKGGFWTGGFLHLEDLNGAYVNPWSTSALMITSGNFFNPLIL